MSGIQRFRKRPVVVEAHRFLTTADAVDIRTWILDSGGSCVARPGARSVVILTLEGDMRADAGDWIVRGVQGEFYPVKPDVFEATYEPAPDA